SCRARMTRTAISPRFATRTRSNTVERNARDRLELEQELAELDRLCVVDVDRANDPLALGLDLVHQLHRLEDAERLPGTDRVADLDERRRVGLRRAVEGADHRRLDPDEAVRRRRDRSEIQLLRGGERRRRPAHRSGTIDAATHRYAHVVLVDRHLADARLLDDADDLADPIRPRALEAAALE